jgi:hypothetical protein
VCIALSFAAVPLGQAQPPPAVLAQFRSCDGTPCFLGIVPGETRIDVASVILGSAGFQFNANERVFYSADRETRVFLTFNGTSTIQSIMVQFVARAAPNIAQMMQTFGKPCEMFAGAPFVLDFAGLNALTSSHSSYGFVRVRPTTRVLSVYDNARYQCGNESYVGTAWRGFARYLSANP